MLDSTKKLLYTYVSFLENNKKDKLIIDNWIYVGLHTNKVVNKIYVSHAEYFGNGGRMKIDLEGCELIEFLENTVDEKVLKELEEDIKQYLIQKV